MGMTSVILSVAKGLSFSRNGKALTAIFFILPHIGVRHARNKLKVSVSMDGHPQTCEWSSIDL